ncbi:MAG: hypothetical protein P4L71_01915 [Acetobacteraceae bacterium]|nr:hypothetical protein [Acetobacteraceae bacterium]
MGSATFTTLFSAEITNDYGITSTTSLIHRTAGITAAGSGTNVVAEAWIVRSQPKGQPCFYGRIFNDRLAALDEYMARTAVRLERAVS